MVWYESMFPIEAMCKLPYQPGHRTAPEDNKLYFVTLLILDSNLNIYVSQKAQNATQAFAPLRGLFYADTPLTHSCWQPPSYSARVNTAPSTMHHFCYHAAQSRRASVTILWCSTTVTLRADLPYSPIRERQTPASSKRSSSSPELSKTCLPARPQRYPAAPGTAFSYLRLQEIQTMEKLKHSKHFYCLSAPEAQ